LASATAWGQKSQHVAANEPVSTDLAVTYTPERAQVISSQCCFWMQGGAIDASVTFWKRLGIAASLIGDHASDVTLGVDVNKVSYLAGPRYTYTAWTKPAGAATRPRYQIFGQGLVGGVHGFDGVYPGSLSAASSANAFVLQAGGGFNYNLTKQWGLRVLEVDYVRTELPNHAADVQSGLRLGFGVTYHMGSVPPPPVTLACSATPVSVFPGDPVSLTATASGLNPKLNAIYSWSGTGVTGNGPAVAVATAALAPGNYTVKCGVKEGRTNKEGLKTGQSADASASFVVKPFEPPTVACSANPGTLKPGETATIAATGASPQNRPLSYSYTASAGIVSGNGPTATYNSTGAPTGAAEITCNVSDDKGQTATASARVTIAAPYLAPAPHTQALCAISFERDNKRPARVDNEAKACLDEVALSLKRQSDAKAVVVGSATAKEKTAKKGHQKAKAVDFAAMRAVNVKDYLVAQGIDAARIGAATDSADGQKVADYLVPRGATFTADVEGAVAVDESTVKPQERKPLGAKQKHKESAPAAR
jgi:hypothetical protein